MNGQLLFFPFFFFFSFLLFSFPIYTLHIKSTSSSSSSDLRVRCRWHENHLSTSHATSSLLSSSPSSVVPFLLVHIPTIPPFPIFFFFRWMCIYLLPIFIYGKRLKSAQVTIRCDGDATELKGNEKCREKKQQERRCHWNRPSFSNNFL